MKTINVLVNGALGKMGREVAKAVSKEPNLKMIAASDNQAESQSYELPNGAGSVILDNQISKTIDNVHVVVDFSTAEGAMSVIRTASAHKVNVVIGSTGLSEANYQEAERVADKHQVGIIIAPNFAVGAVLMMHLAKEAARFFDYAELTETHHEAKIDAPSGTAIAIAQAALQGKEGSFSTNVTEKELIPHTRGGMLQGLRIHSSRMPGRVAHHELVFGALGQTLTLRHDSINRESFMPGVILAINEVVKNPGLTVGLEKTMGL